MTKGEKVYIIKRNNRRMNNKVFGSYEEARSYARKWLRTRYNELVNKLFKSRNIPISHFKITIVAQ